MSQQTSSPPRSGEPDVGDGLSIQVVSRLLDVPAPTIRSWERRYGVPPTSRSTGGHRRFFRDELVMLQQMRDEIVRGRRAADAAALVLDAARSPSPYQARVDEALIAAVDFDAAAVRGQLLDAADSLGLEAAVTGVLLPLMRSIGRWWESGRCDVAHEQLVTQVSRGWLSELRQQAQAPWRAETVALTCGPRDAHTLGLEAMAVLLPLRGFGCRLLGSRPPGRHLTAAVDASGASALIMVSHMAVTRRAAVEELRTLPSSRLGVFYAGNAFLTPQARAGVPGTYLGEDLSAAADFVAATVPSQCSSTVTRGPAVSRVGV